MVPEGWIEGRVGDLLIGLESGVSVNGENKPLQANDKGVLKVSAVSYGQFLPSAAKVMEDKEIYRAKTNPKAGQIIVSRSNTAELVGASAFIKKDYPDLFLPDKLWQTIPKKESDMKWLSYVLSTDHTRYILSNLATGTSGSMKNITKNELLSLKIIIPPSTEQKKIAKILSTWDNAITVTEQLLANSQQQKKALMQQLLTGKKRFPEFNEDWTKRPISDFIKESRIPGSSGDIAQKITVKLYARGVFPKKEKRLGSESTKYYKRQSGQFIYSKLDFLNGALGIIPKSLDGYESTLDLPAFDFLPGTDHKWFVYFVSREEFYKAKIGLANGSRKARRVNPKDFLTLKIGTPGLKEQQKIASVLTCADKEIENLKQKINYLKQEKKALMQQLLTGKRRVRIENKDKLKG